MFQATDNMATIKDFGIPACGRGILSPYKIWIEHDRCYNARVRLINEGKQEDADKIRDILYRAMDEINQYVTDDDRKW